MLQHNENDIHRSILVLREPDSVWSPDAKAGVLASAEAIHRGLEQAGYDVIPVQAESANALLTELLPYNPARYPVFNWFEGFEPDAEDLAQVTALLDEIGFVYTGSDTVAIRMSQNKIRTRRVLLAHGIPTPEGQPVSAGTLRAWSRFPAIVKLATEHGSESLTSSAVVQNPEELFARVAELQFAGFDSLMVSEFIDGREFTISLWGNGTLEMLPLLEVDYSACPASMPHIRSFEAKWDTASNAYRFVKLAAPRDLGFGVEESIERVARETYRAFKLRDYARIDLRLRGETPYVIDVNSNPDITPDSSFVAAAQRAGEDYSAMLDRIVRLAIHRAGARQAHSPHAAR